MVIKDTPVFFNNKLDVQVDGVAIGSCLGSTLPNAILCHHKTKWLNECPSEFKSMFYRRYVDDTFLLFTHSQNFPKFLSYLNSSKHLNTEFTCDTENNGSISFVDVTVTRNNNQLHTAVYRKPTFTRFGINYLSFIPQLFNINAIKTLLYRCYALSSNWFAFHHGFKFLMTFFHNIFPVKHHQ